MPDGAILLLLSRNYDCKLAVAPQHAGNRSRFRHELGAHVQVRVDELIQLNEFIDVDRELAAGISKSSRAT